MNTLPEQARFCLDVGTRKVCGLLVEGEAGAARVTHFSVREHPGRAMIDGQVQSVGRAAGVVGEVKTELEAESGLRLGSVHVAVAGRSLALGRIRLKFKTGHTEPLTHEEIAAMELQAAREARAELADPQIRADSHCVGYSVLSATLDGQALSELAGHRGAEVELEVLATFLPRLALESLLEVLRLAGLTAASLTLEPIAAVQLMVPPDLRRLNLALVDVGAGTSDIALTRDGHIDAYAMVPVAGDEVTEHLADTFVLDFMQAEALKRSAPNFDVDIPDIFGVHRRFAAAQVAPELEAAGRRWAESCAETIRRLNGGKAPQAVILAGGGSLLPGAPRCLAEALGLQPERVGHRPLSAQDCFVDLPVGLLQPWAVTPLGIAASALARQGLPFVGFEINGKAVMALKLKQNFTAFDALLALGNNTVRFHGRPGRVTAYAFNGRERVAKGAFGGVCRLFVGGRPTGLESVLDDGACLTFVEAADGEDGVLSFSEALEKEGLQPGHFRFNGEDRALPVEVTCDGRSVTDLTALVPDRSRLEVRLGATLRSVLRREGVDLDGLIDRRIAVTVEGEPRVLTQRNYSLKLNAREAGLDSVLAESDRVDFEPGAGSQERVRDLWGPGAPRRQPPVPKEGACKVLLNGEWAPLDPVERVWMNGREVGLDEFLVDGADVRVERRGPCRTVEEALVRLGVGAWLRGGRLKVLLDGKPVTGAEALRDGDPLELRFEAAVRGR